jgi:quercetin dioxygenase-like cupin family protein
MTHFSAHRPPEVTMPYAIYDYRRDIKNLFVTPQIRGRFLRMEPGEVHGRHSHDLGHEVFLILEGQCDLEIDGVRAVLGPGQLCVAFAHQMHQARNAGDGPMTMYLSVTPHIEPTHTVYHAATGERLPPRYNPPTAFDKADTLGDTPTSDLADRYLAAMGALAELATTALEAQTVAVAALKEATHLNDGAAIAAAMDGLWAQFYGLYRQFNGLSLAWNDLAPRAADRGSIPRA